MTMLHFHAPIVAFVSFHLIIRKHVCLCIFVFINKFVRWVNHSNNLLLHNSNPQPLSFTPPPHRLSVAISPITLTPLIFLHIPISLLFSKAHSCLYYLSYLLSQFSSTHDLPSCVRMCVCVCVCVCVFVCVNGVLAAEFLLYPLYNKVRVSLS